LDRIEKAITFTKYLSIVPDYRITIHMKIGPPKVGLRWHPSYDTDYVRRIVEEKVKKTLGSVMVKWVDVEIVSRTTGNRIETKNL
jgi:hypothetical protein